MSPNGALAIVAVANAARLLVDSRRFVGGWRRSRDSYRWLRTGNKVVQDEISQLPDLRLAEFRLPGNHGGPGHAIGDCGDQSFARNGVAEGGVGEVARRWYEALLSMGGAVASIPVADGAVEAKAFFYGVFCGHNGFSAKPETDQSQDQ